MSRRYDELDSLRGLAALTVVLGHLLFAFPQIGGVISESAINYTPLRTLWNGHAAVVFFFILSGFVLSLPFLTKVKLNYPVYLLRRLCRIYIPYVCLILIAVITKVLLASKIGSVPGLEGWSIWDAPVSISLIIKHLMFIGSYNSDAFIMVVWSLVHEMRISIIFPLIVLFIFRFDWKVSVALCMFLSSSSLVLNKVFDPDIFSTTSTNYFFTLHYISMFIFGGLVAKHKTILIEHMKRPLNTVILSAVSLVCYCYYEIVTRNINGILNDWVISAGSLSILVIVLSRKNLLSKFLLFRPVHFVGQMSYSLYLAHPLVLLSLIHVLNGKLPTPIILLLSFVMTFLCSALVYYCVEIPSIKLGKRVGNTIKKGAPQKSLAS